MLQIIFESISVQKAVSEVLKTWYFPYSALWSAGQGGGAIVQLLIAVSGYK